TSSSSASLMAFT
ncbi:hypothetical protein D037_0655B, partial [Vibrio parahaemolyticus IDH02640]